MAIVLSCYALFCLLRLKNIYPDLGGGDGGVTAKDE